MTGDLLLWSIPLIILAVAMLGMRRYSPLNLARHVGRDDHRPGDTGAQHERACSSRPC